MNDHKAPRSIEIELSQLEPASKELMRKLRLVRQSEELNRPYRNRKEQDRAWLLHVVEFLDTVFPDAMLELLSAPGSRMAADLQEELQRDVFPTKGSPRKHPYVALLRLTALAGIDALTLNGWDVSTARDFVARVLTEARETTDRGNKITRRTLEDWAEWFERQPDAFDAGSPKVSREWHRKKTRQVFTDAIDAGTDPETAVRFVVQQTVQWLGQ